jgi:hypothetical protein
LHIDFYKFSSNLDIFVDTDIIEQVERSEFWLIAQKSTGFDFFDHISCQVDFAELFVGLENIFSEFFDFVGLKIDNSQICAIFEGVILDFSDVVEGRSQSLQRPTIFQMIQFFQFGRFHFLQVLELTEDTGRDLVEFRIEENHRSHFGIRFSYLMVCSDADLFILFNVSGLKSGRSQMVL